MIELQDNQFDIALPLAKEMDYCNTIYAIIEKTIKGKIWVDDLSKPTIALYWDGIRRLYLVGDYTNNKKNDKIGIIVRDQILASGTKRKLTQWTFHFEPFEWKEHIHEMIVDYLPLDDTRLCYQFEKDKCTLQENWKQSLRDGHLLELVDEDFLDNYVNAKNFKDIHYELGSWMSHEVFFQEGFGFCIIDNMKIAAWCMGEYVSPRMKRIEIGIETYQEYQKQGFATLTGSALVKHALKNGFELIGWHCWERNVASAKTAEKIGYKLKKKYPVIFGWYNKIDQLIARGWMNRRILGNYEAAIDYYNQVISLDKQGDPSIKGSHLLDDVKQIKVSIAEATCQLGKLDDALKIIQRVIAKGYTDFDRLEKSEDLEPLKTNPKWKKIMEEKE